MKRLVGQSDGMINNRYMNEYRVGGAVTIRSIEGECDRPRVEHKSATVVGSMSINALLHRIMNVRSKSAWSDDLIDWIKRVLLAHASYPRG